MKNLDKHQLIILPLISKLVERSDLSSELHTRIAAMTLRQTLLIDLDFMKIIENTRHAIESKIRIHTILNTTQSVIH